MSRIYLIRHGETEWNKLLRFQGREDIELNDSGREQIRTSAEKLLSLGCKAEMIYTSPLKRAYETGQIIAEKLKLDQSRVLKMNELIERDLGEFSGQYIKDRQDYFAMSASRDREGELFDTVLTRMETALEKMDQAGYDEIIAVSHGAAINILLAGLSNNEVGTGKTRLWNGGITVLEKNPVDKFVIKQLNLQP